MNRPRKPPADAHREVRILDRGAVEHHITVTGERGHDRAHLRKREVLADAAPRAQPERDERALLFLVFGEVTSRIKTQRIRPYCDAALHATRVDGHGQAA